MSIQLQCKYFALIECKLMVIQKLSSTWFNITIQIMYPPYHIEIVLEIEGFSKIEVGYEEQFDENIR